MVNMGNPGYTLNQKNSSSSFEKSPTDNINIKQVLLKIDNQHFAKYVSQMIYEISLGDETKRTQAYEIMKLALRWALLLDLFYETNKPIFYEESEKQLSELFKLLPQNHHRDLIYTEKNARKYFDFEKELRIRIHANDRFSKKDIRQYLFGKSGDALFYGRLLKALTPSWNLTNELRIQTILFDIGKDITDYDDDVKHGFPNVLYLFFSGTVERDKIPQDTKGAIRLANEMRVSSVVLKLATKLKENALKSKNLYRSPTLQETIIDHYSRIEQFFASTKD